MECRMATCVETEQPWRRQCWTTERSTDGTGGTRTVLGTCAAGRAGVRAVPPRPRRGVRRNAESGTHGRVVMSTSGTIEWE